MNDFRLRWALALLAAGIWFALIVGRALTQAPFIDEALYSLPAWNLATNGLRAMPDSMGKGVIWTETDVGWDHEYLHQGHMPAGILIESGRMATGGLWLAVAKIRHDH